MAGGNSHRTRAVAAPGLTTSHAASGERLAGRGGQPAVLEPLGRQRWTGASGHTIALVVYSLIGCPAISGAIFLLVRREADGRARLLAAGRTRSRHPGLNLAAVRRRGARLGANEVHVAPVPGNDTDRARLAEDLLGGPRFARTRQCARPR